MKEKGILRLLIQVRTFLSIRIGRNQVLSIRWRHKIALMYKDYSIKVLPTALTIETKNEPISAVIKPETAKPSTNEAVKIKSAALIKNINKPRVRIVIGSVKIISSGFINTLSNPKMSAAIIAGYKPDTSIPGITEDASKSARAVIRILMIIFI